MILIYSISLKQVWIVGALGKDEWWYNELSETIIQLR